MQSHWITGYFPPGTEISITAHVVINHKSQFSAIKVERIADIREETVDARLGVSTKNIVRKMEDALEYWRSTGALQDCIAEHDSVGPLLRNPLLTSSEEGRLKSIEDRLVEKFL